MPTRWLPNQHDWNQRGTWLEGNQLKTWSIFLTEQAVNFGNFLPRVVEADGISRRFGGFLGLFFVVVVRVVFLKVN